MNSDPMPYGEILRNMAKVICVRAPPRFSPSERDLGGNYESPEITRWRNMRITISDGSPWAINGERREGHAKTI